MTSPFTKPCPVLLQHLRYVLIMNKTGDKREAFKTWFLLIFHSYHGNNTRCTKGCHRAWELEGKIICWDQEKLLANGNRQHLVGEVLNSLLKSRRSQGVIFIRLLLVLIINVIDNDNTTVVKKNCFKFWKGEFVQLKTLSLYELVLIYQTRETRINQSFKHREESWNTTQSRVCEKHCLWDRVSDIPSINN